MDSKRIVYIGIKNSMFLLWIKKLYVAIRYIKTKIHCYYGYKSKVHCYYGYKN